MKKQVFDVTFRCEAKMLSTVISVMSNTADVALQSVTLVEAPNGHPPTTSKDFRAKARNVVWATKGAPAVMAGLRELLKTSDPTSPGIHYKDLAKHLLQNGPVPGIHKEGSITTMLSALVAVGKVVRTQRGYYRVP